MSKFDRYLSDINPEILEDLARKRRKKTLIEDILGGLIWFGMIFYICYLVLCYA